MMGDQSSKKAVWALRLGLGATYIYSGYDLFMHPGSWQWAVRGLPLFIQNIIGAIGINTYLQIQGIAELLFAAVLVFWFLPKKWVRFVSILIVLEMASILVLVGIDPITFRDFGLVGAAAALFFLL